MPLKNIRLTVIRSDRRTLSLYLKQGEIIARAPLRMTDKEIHAFIEEKRGWIEKNLVRLGEQQRAADEIQALHSGGNKPS